MTKISSLEEYISIIKELYSMEDSVEVYKIYYRGQNNSNYNLIPSLSHKIKEIDDEDSNYIAFEQSIIERAKLEYPEIFKDTNSIDELALMQHYGLPTRLMDVTENPLVTLYFACRKNEENSGEVFIFNTGVHAQIYTSYDEELLKEKNEIAFIRAKNFSSRQRAQQGLFMWFPDNKLKGIEKNVDINPVISKIITIPAEHKANLLKELKMVGISPKSLFPDNIDFCCMELVKDITKNAFSA